MVLTLATRKVWVILDFPGSCSIPAVALQTASQRLHLEARKNPVVTRMQVSAEQSERRRSSMVPTGEGQKQSLAVHYAASAKKGRSGSVASVSSFGGKSKRHSLSHRLFKMPEIDNVAESPPVQYLNTYKLGPDAGRRFLCKPVKDIIESTLKRKLEDCTYKADKCRRLAASISEEVKNNVKILGFERYKIVCFTQIGALNNQGLRCASRCLWDPSNDCSVTGSYANSTLFACVTVFGVYRE